MINNIFSVLLRRKLLNPSASCFIVISCLLYGVLSIGCKSLDTQSNNLSQCGVVVHGMKPSVYEFWSFSKCYWDTPLGEKVQYAYPNSTFDIPTKVYVGNIPYNYIINSPAFEFELPNFNFRDQNATKFENPFSIVVPFYTVIKPSSYQDMMFVIHKVEKKSITDSFPSSLEADSIKESKIWIPTEQEINAHLEKIDSLAKIYYLPFAPRGSKKKYNGYYRQITKRKINIENCIAFSKNGFDCYLININRYRYEIFAVIFNTFKPFPFILTDRILIPTSLNSLRNVTIYSGHFTPMDKMKLPATENPVVLLKDDNSVFLISSIYDEDFYKDISSPEWRIDDFYDEINFPVPIETDSPDEAIRWLFNYPDSVTRRYIK